MKSAKLFEENNKTYFEVTLENDEGKSLTQRFKFESKAVAISLQKQIKFGKSDYDEIFFSLPNFKDDDE